MIATRNMYLRIQASFVAHLVATDAGSPLRVVPIGNAFTPSPNLTIEDLIISPFLGALGTRDVMPALTRGARDPGNDEECLVLAFDDAVADRQNVDVADNPLPQQVHGYALVTSDLTQVLGAHKFAAPINYTEVGQLLQWGEISFRYPVSSVR